MTRPIQPLLQYLTRRAETMRRIGKPAHEEKLLRWRASVKALQAAAAAKSCDGCAYNGEHVPRCELCARKARRDGWTEKYVKEGTINGFEYAK